MNIDSHRIAKFIEALLIGEEIKYQDKTYVIDEGLRIGYCIGEIFYEISFSSLVSELSGIPDDVYIQVCFRLAQSKAKIIEDEVDALLDSDIDDIVDDINIMDKIDELGESGVVSLDDEDSSDEFIDSLLKELEAEGNEQED